MTANETAILSQMDKHYSQLCACSSTSGRKYNYDKMVGLLTAHPFLAKFWELREHMYYYIDRIVRKVQDVAQKIVERIAPSLRVEWNNIQPMPDGVEQLYLIRLLDADKKLVYSKVGTTTRPTGKRMTEHLRDYAKDGVKYVEIMRLWDCGDVPAEAFESSFRSRYIRDYPGAFRRNDRFIGIEFDLNKADVFFEKIKAGE